jgi:hypothetical protein
VKRRGEDRRGEGRRIIMMNKLKSKTDCRSISTAEHEDVLMCRTGERLK